MNSKHEIRWTYEVRSGKAFGDTNVYHWAKVYVNGEVAADFFGTFGPYVRYRLRKSIRRAVKGLIP